MTPAQKAWLSAFLPSLSIVIIIIYFTLTSYGELNADHQLNVLFWSMVMICVISFCALVICLLWPDKKERIKARKRRKRNRV